MCSGLSNPRSEYDRLMLRYISPVWHNTLKGHYVLNQLIFEKLSIIIPWTVKKVSFLHAQMQILMQKSNVNKEICADFHLCGIYFCMTTLQYLIYTHFCRISASEHYNKTSFNS